MSETLTDKLRKIAESNSDLYAPERETIGEAADLLDTIKKMVAFNGDRPDLIKSVCCPGCVHAYVDEEDDFHDGGCLYLKLKKAVGA